MHLPVPQQVDSQRQIPAGSEMEVEIRACTIAAVEMLQRALDARLQSALPAATSLSSEPTAAHCAPQSTAGIPSVAAGGGNSPAATAKGPAAVAASTGSAGKEFSDDGQSAGGQRSQGVTAVAIDWWLWGRGEAQRDTAPPHHRTLTIYY